MSLKITGGLFKGARLDTPAGKVTRPTAEVVREAVFNICQNQIHDAHVLDLYAGSGAIGIEAISRGAKACTFIEKDRHALHALKNNLAKLAIEDQALILPYDVTNALKKLSGSFDIVYIDPPYGEKNSELASEKALLQILSIFDTQSLLNDGASIFIEFSSYSKRDFSALPHQHLRWKNSRKFGRSNLHLLNYCVTPSKPI